jgi:hypothetical protein
MAWGGSRMGSGRKRTQLGVIPGGRRGLADVPAGVVGVAAAFWADNAGKAIEAGTLTDQTLEDWRVLCELAADRAARKAAIDRDGLTCVKVVIDGAGNEVRELRAHPLISALDRANKQFENQLARFSLAPFGKPVPTAAATAKPAANPWASIVGR